ncbi:hypothetical protein MVEN_01197800 [Mycena venus]|uniref:Uncharacterized protein n=1 Tax=Mycena venus TaxID=2733690 RepID=A0A8H6Y5K2_9AGAR|nr:hypothetical protein MVEN_01197800 [Mycena venus]
MAFARPTTSKAPGNTTRGRPGSSATTTGARPGKTKAATQGRTPSVSSTSSERSSHSGVSAKDAAATKPLDGSSRPNSRAASACSDRSSRSVSAVNEPEPRPSNLPSSGAQRSAGQTNSSPSSTQPAQSGSAPQPTTDSLQVAAQVYPWLYMTSTLEACFKSAETAAEKDLTAREAELAEEESDLVDQRARLEAERKIEFYEELSTDKFATAAPSIMQAFLAHGDACTLLEAEALQLATSPNASSEDDYYSPMRPYNTLLERLEEKQREQRELHASIVALTQDGSDDGGAEEDADPEQPSARAQIMHVFSACLPVLQARAANLQMAHELLEGAKENLAMSIHLESLEVSESDEE